MGKYDDLLEYLWEQLSYVHSDNKNGWAMCIREIESINDGVVDLDE